MNTHKPTSQFSSKGKAIWYYTALVLASLLYVAMLLLCVVNLLDYFSVTLFLMTLGVLLGIVGVFLCLKKKWGGALLGIAPMVSTYIGSMGMKGADVHEFQILAMALALPLILLLSITPIIKTIATHRKKEIAAENLYQKPASTQHQGTENHPLKIFVLILMVITFAQIALFFLPWLTLPRDSYLYKIPDIMNLSRVLWRFSSNAFLLPTIFLFVTVGAMALASILQLVESMFALAGKSINRKLIRLTTFFSIVACVAVAMMFITFWINILTGILPTPWLAIIPISLVCQILFGRSSLRKKQTTP